MDLATIFACIGMPAFAFGFVLGMVYSSKKVYYMERGPDDGWLPIHEKPIPEDAQDILVTDGLEVSYEYKPRYNSRGHPIMYKSMATHWRPLPAPPKSAKKTWIKKPS